MLPRARILLLTAMALAWRPVAQAEIKVLVEHNASDQAGAAFKFAKVPAPSKADAATRAKFTIVDGERDENGGTLARLHDGRVPKEEDQPGENFFFRQGADGGRLRIDLGTNVTIKQINSYSWHANTRGPQVYQLYASDGKAEGFNAEPKKSVGPESCGWKRIAKVDTRPETGQGGGQYGVSISDSEGNIGQYRYLLFDIARTEDRDPFGNTFYSEIDVIDPNAPEATAAEEEKPVTKSFETGDGKYHFTIDATVAPDLMEWADTKLRPVVQEWYPKLVEMLPSEGFQARTNVTLRFRDDMRQGIPAMAGGGGVSLNARWFAQNLKGEARGAVVHEMVHVVQSYGWGRRRDPERTRTPDWLVEGIPDYIRWFLYEPESKGAEITRRNIDEARYDASYRVTGNFLNWVTEKYDTNIVRKLNAAGRAGKYREEIWKEATGKTVQELGDEWKKYHTDRLAAARRKTNAADGEKKSP